MVKVAIDAAGGDYGISTTIPAGLEALSKFPDLFINFVGNQELINAELTKHPKATQFTTKFTITHAIEVVEMTDKLSVALRQKKDSSMRVAINLIKEQVVDGCVSAGNTGALMAISRFVLKTIDGINRPAIMSNIPTINGHTHMLDLGANVDSSPQELLEFAMMGAVAVSEIKNIKNPTIGLLNIGEEEIKGNEKIKQTAELLKNTSLNYYGFVEGDDIFKGTVDLVVCDGFEGNIALKSSEGAVTMMGVFIKNSFNKSLFTKIVAIIANSIIKDFKAKIDPDKYNGATLLGLKGVVIKSHGGANKFGFLQAITETYIESKAKLTEKIAVKVNTELDKTKE